MSTPLRRTKTDLRRGTAGRPQLLDARPVETSPAEAAMLLGEPAPPLASVKGTEPARQSGDEPSKSDL